LGFIQNRTGVTYQPKWAKLCLNKDLKRDLYDSTKVKVPDIMNFYPFTQLKWLEI